MSEQVAADKEMQEAQELVNATSEWLKSGTAYLERLPRMIGHYKRVATDERARADMFHSEAAALQQENRVLRSQLNDTLRDNQALQARLAEVNGAYNRLATQREFERQPAAQEGLGYLPRKSAF